MAKRRLNSKKIAQTPSLKRNLALIIAEFADRDPQLSLTNMLAYGHRGYISYDENKLCKLFDKLFSKELEQYAEKKKELEHEIKFTSYSWSIEEHKRELLRLDEHINKFYTIANEIFEDKVLL